MEQDGQFITAKGPGAAMEFGYTLAALYVGEAVNELRRGMIYAELLGE